MSPTRPRGSWRDRIPAEEWTIFAGGGYGVAAPRGLRPALLVIDATNRFVGVDGPLEASQAIYPSSTGERAWSAVACAADILAAARAGNYPRIYTVRDENVGVQRNQLRKEKHQAASKEPPEANLIVGPLEPGPSEVVLPKSKPSPFHGTALLSMLVYLRVDSVIIVGGVTSGCIRACAVDAFSLGYRVMVPEDAVFDRSEFLHAAHLFDIEQKYGEVCSADTAIRYLQETSRAQDEEDLA